MSAFSWATCTINASKNPRRRARAQLLRWHHPSVMTLRGGRCCSGARIIPGGVISTRLRVRHLVAALYTRYSEQGRALESLPKLPSRESCKLLHAWGTSRGAKLATVYGTRESTVTPLLNPSFNFPMLKTQAKYAIPLVCASTSGARYVPEESHCA